jgi:hypothetical protein
MKFSTRIALALCILSLSTALPAVALAQTSNINSVTSPTSSNLNAVCIVNNSTDVANDLQMLNAWAVGDGGTIAMWSGSSWTTVTSPTAMNLYSVVFNNATSGWAVGGSSSQGVILYYNGTWNEWKTVSFNGQAGGTDPINSTLYGVTVTIDGMNGWIVGSNGIALNWYGGTWYGSPSVSTNTLRSVAMYHGIDDAWAVGDSGTILHWDGAQWTTMTSNTVQPLYTISVLNSSFAMAAGGSGSTGVVLMMNSSGWSTYTNFRFGGGSGTMTSSLNSTVNSITLASATSGWACGDGGITMYWTGSEWDCNSNPTMGNLNSISMIHGGSAIQAWTVGDGGVILAFNGSNWVPELPVIAVPVVLAIGLVAALFAKAKLSKKPLPL